MAKFLQARKRPSKNKKRQWAKSKPKTTQCNPERAPDQAVTKLPWHSSLIPAGCFGFSHVKNAVNSTVKTFISLLLWFHISVKKYFIPRIVGQRELRTLRQRLQKLEAEFSKLSTALQNQDTNSYPASNTCCCNCNKKKLFPSPTIASNVQSAEQCPLTSIPPPPPPPPPLPPPPPPLPPPAFQLQKQPLLKKVESNRVPKDVSKVQDGIIQITLKDLLNVKLRKTASNMELHKVESQPIERFPRITLSELQGVNLNRSSKMHPRRLSCVFKGTPNKSPLDVRRRLRKVNMVRSPGGTPIYDRDNKENGTGLTPMMTRALRQKFQMALPKSPSPRRLTQIRRGFEDEQ
uniref:Proline rich 11 n=1 Tax=Leptobrachium leishanense TaxID=445787 RepID=A0A8C5P7G0_9ANUR